MMAATDHSLNLTHIQIRDYIPITLDTNQKNYQLWRCSFETLCLSFSIFDHLDGTSPSTSSTDTQWIQIDNTIKMWIYNTISEPLLNSVGNRNCSARQLWTTIEDLFSNNNNYPQRRPIRLIWHIFGFIFGISFGFFLDTSHTVHLTAQQASQSLQHQVFISFRGQQLRNNFISHLEAGLRREGINVFIDKHEDRGVLISNIFKRIEESKTAIVVFSSEYTKSNWCLNEAEKIKELAAQGKLKVLPIFYKVTTNDVKQLKGEFGDHFRDREREYRNNTSVIEKWKDALEFITGILGLEMNDQSDENSFINSAVEDVSTILNSIQ